MRRGGELAKKIEQDIADAPKMAERLSTLCLIASPNSLG
jgi:hypothetical protein